MDPSCLVSTVQAGGGGVMVWGLFSWHTLGPLIPIEHRLNITVKMLMILLRGIIQNACYCLFSTDLNRIFYLNMFTCSSKEKIILFVCLFSDSRS